MQRPRPVETMSGAPQVGWVIMSGDADNPDHDFICQSNPRSECVIQASRADAKTNSAVYFYYHSAAVETRYTGTIQLGFLEGESSSHQLRPDFTVKPKDSVAKQSVVGIVSSTPGTYAMAIDVVAVPTGSDTKQNIQEKVQVVVR
jgi:hypothetical protein